MFYYVLIVVEYGKINILGDEDQEGFQKTSMIDFESEIDVMKEENPLHYCNKVLSEEGYENFGVITIIDKNGVIKDENFHLN